MLGGDDEIEVDLDAFVPRGSVFNLGGTEFIADADSEEAEVGGYDWTVSSAPSWSDGQRVTVSANLAPGVTSATVAADKLVLTFTENLDTASEPDPSAFTVTVAGTAVTVNDVDMSGKTVTLTLASAVTSVQIVTVAYAPPSMNPLQDTSGSDAPAFTAQAEQTLVSNTGQTLETNLASGLTRVRRSPSRPAATPPATCSRASAYAPPNRTNQNQSDIRVRIFTVDSDGEPDSALYTLTNPCNHC